jgi:hypothetical protein
MSFNLLHVCCSTQEWRARSQVLTRAINLTCVTVRDRQKMTLRELDNWPSGPQASLGYSDDPNTTWRGGALPMQFLKFFTKGKSFRTNMYTATSFNKSTALEFMTRVGQVGLAQIVAAAGVRWDAAT